MKPRFRLGVARLIAELVAGQSSASELTELTGLARSTVMCWLNDLRTVGVVRIGGWDRIHTGQATCPLYELNPDGKKDAPRPKQRALTPAERTQRYRDRKKLLAASWAAPLIPSQMEGQNKVLAKQRASRS